MCGITGILGKVGAPNERKHLLEKMTTKLAHRGPDGWGTYLADDVALGHRRLSIIDVDGGHQPMATDRFVVSFNGEIFNYIELRQELEQKGYRFRTTSDTEVLLRVYEEYGRGSFEKLNGQFAFLLWDRRDRVLTAARDRYGIRPLYALRHGGGTYFASEMKAFDQIPGFTRRYDPELLLEHGLLWNSVGSDTVYQGIRSIPGGTVEDYSLDGSYVSFRYYQLGQDCIASPATLEEAEEDLVSILRDSVKLRLRSDVPVGNYLSGGVDSSVITDLTRLYNKKFKTFSVSFSDAAYDESRYQRQMVDLIQSEHHDCAIGYDSINDSILTAAYHIERPVFRTAPVPLFLLSRAVQENGIKVVLTGEAADEILFGYDTYKEIALLSAWESDPESPFAEQAIRQLYPHLSHYKDPKQFGFMKMYYKSFVGNIDNALVGLNIRIQNNSALERVMGSTASASTSRERLAAKIEQTLPPDFSRWTLLQRNQFLEMNTLLSGYLLSSQGDRMSMAHGVEGRYPFLDHRLVERVFGYRDEFKLNGLSQKHVLRKAFSGSIPAEIIDRPKMPYQAPDLKSFFRNGSLTEEARRFLSDEAIRAVGLFDPTYVGRLVKKYSTRMPDAIGYRDNMIFIFILTTQAGQYWIDNPVDPVVDYRQRTVDLVDATPV